MPAPSGSTAVFGFSYQFESDVPDLAPPSQDLAQGVETELLLMLPGTILASKYIAPPSYGTTSNSPVAMDATNAKLTFTAPHSGNVLLQESCEWGVSNVATGIGLVWATSATANTGLVGSEVYTGSIGTATFATAYKVLEHYWTGLTPGTPYTVYLQWYAGTNPYSVYCGNTGQQALILKAIAL